MWVRSLLTGTTMASDLELKRLAERLLWLADAPSFIDADQVDRFHDAVVRPGYREVRATFEQGSEKSAKLEGKIGAEASVKPNAILAALTALVPFVDAELKANVEIGAAGEFKGTNTRTVEIERIRTPQRQLEQLVLHYLVHHQDRLFIPDPPWEGSWKEPAAALKVPRGLVLLDLPPGVKIIPTAAEFEDGVVEQIFMQFKGADNSEAPPYPDPVPVVDSSKLMSERMEYWSWFEKNVKPSTAMKTIEKVAASRQKRITWIDYRIPMSDKGDTVHLHISPRGLYDTGTFAYRLVKRGFKHGVRIVATLRSEPDLNVLAIYEK
jgi:hypothetical protein